MSTAQQCLTVCAAFANAQQRATLIAAFDVRDALVAALQVSDEVRPIKSAWWQDELERLQAAEPRHPAAIALFRANGPIDRTLAREWLVLAERIRDGIQAETWSDFEIDAFRRFGVALALAFLSAAERDTDAGMASVATAASAFSAVDQGVDDDTRVAALVTVLSELRPQTASAPLAALLATLKLSLERMATGRKPPGRFALTLSAWRAARASQKRNPQ
ncbi:MAG: hypothetical protein AAGF46_03505 [Pseudomonadota bacterium]